MGKSVLRLESNKMIYRISGLFSKYLTLFVIGATFLFMGLDMAFAKLGIYSFEEKVNKSDIIIHGKVKEIRKYIFRKNESLIDVNQVIIGKVKEKQVEIKFGRKNIFFAQEDLTNLKVGCEYIFFLKKDEHLYWIVGAHKGYYEIQKNNKICVGNEYIELKQFIDEIISVHK